MLAPILLLLLFSALGPDYTAEACDVNPADIVYYFFNTQNPVSGIGVPAKNPAAIKNTHFDKNKETIVLVHGGGGNTTGLLITATRNAIFKAKIDMNIIAVDWYQVQLHNDYSKIYDCTPGFGQVVGGFFNTMISSYGLNTGKLTIVGHSIAGKFCAALSEQLKGKVKYMVGLETGWIGTNHANYVEYIYTATAATGYLTGHADYYPNGGASQPGCSDWKCNHWRSVEYFAESISSNKFIGRKCDNYNNYKAGKCARNATGRFGGLNPDNKANGIFFLNTNAKSPYAQG